MAMSKKGIFRNKAVRYYMQSQERDILPRFVAPPVVVFLWVLLSLLLASTVLAWLAHVPIRVAGSGVVLDQKQGSSNASGAVAVLFLPATSVGLVRPGQTVQIQIGASVPLAATIVTVEPGVKSPNEIKGTYTQIIAEPSVVALVSLGAGISAQMYAGTPVRALVQIGNQRILSLLPGIGQWIGVH
jgi:hypothetical protein